MNWVLLLNYSSSMSTRKPPIDLHVWSTTVHDNLYSIQTNIMKSQDNISLFQLYLAVWKCVTYDWITTPSQRTSSDLQVLFPAFSELQATKESNKILAYYNSSSAMSNTSTYCSWNFISSGTKTDFYTLSTFLLRPSYGHFSIRKHLEVWYPPDGHF